MVEHDPTLYEDAAEMVEYISRVLSDEAKESAVLLYSPGSDPFLEELARIADRILYFDECPRASTKFVTKDSRRRKRARPLWRFSHDQIVIETRGEPGLCA